MDIYNVENGKHSFRKNNASDGAYKCVKWHPKKDVIALVD